MSHYLAKSLSTLRDEVNRHAPKRSKASDGWVGDTSHAARKSDHNPDRARGGVVRALDITHDPKGGCDAGAIANRVASLLGKHEALGSGAYVIFNARIISTDRLPEGWRRYTGSNPHRHHVHVSAGSKRYDSTAYWGVFAAAAPAKKPDPNQKSRRRLLAIEKREKAAGRTRLADHLKNLRIGLRPKKRK